MRQSVSQNGCPIAGNVGVIQEQKNQGRTEKDQPWNRIEEVAHRVEVTQPLRKLEPWSKKRIVGAQDLDHAPGPANALPNMGREPLRGQPRSLGNVDIRRTPALHLHAQRRVRVFGHGLYGDAANLVQSLAAQHGAGTAEEGRVPEVVAILHNAIKQFAFVRNDVELPEGSDAKSTQ